MRCENHKRLTLSGPGQFNELASVASFLAGDGDRPARRVILHPTDYSEPSRQAFALACRIARSHGSRLIVLHVAEPVRVSSLGMAPVPPLPKGYRGAWESRLHLVQPTEPGVRVEHRLEEGDVAAEILRVAQETACDLIVMGTRGHTGLRRRLKGSVTRKVQREAPCPVVAVKLPPAGAGRLSGSSVSEESGTPTCFGVPDGGSATEEIRPPAPVLPAF